MSKKLSKRKRRQNQIDSQQNLYHRCTRKKKYNSEFEAWDTAKKLREWHGVKENLYPYKCRVCHSWHLTKNEQPNTMKA